MTAQRLHTRALVRVAPSDGSEDAAAFLQGLLTNDVTGDLPVYAALLSAQGKTMFDLIVWRDGDTILLDCEAQYADDLAKRLSLYRLRRKLDIARDDSLGVFWSASQPNDNAPNAATDPRLPALGWRWIGPIADGASGIDEAWLAHRLALGIAEGRAELGDILWLETNAAELNGVSFTKGCYIGQENTARMNWRQKINRRLLVVPEGRSEEKRRKAHYPALGLAVDHLRVADAPADLLPAWLDS